MSEEWSSGHQCMGTHPHGFCNQWPCVDAPASDDRGPLRRWLNRVLRTEGDANEQPKKGKLDPCPTTNGPKSRNLDPSIPTTKTVTASSAGTAAGSTTPLGASGKTPSTSKVDGQSDYDRLYADETIEQRTARLTFEIELRNGLADRALHRALRAEAALERVWDEGWEAAAGFGGGESKSANPYRGKSLGGRGGDDRG